MGKANELWKRRGKGSREEVVDCEGKGLGTRD